MLKETTALEKLLKLTKRIRGVSGGSSASKTISILMWLIDYCGDEYGKIVSVVSWTLPHLKKGAIRDFLDIMEQHNYFKENRWNKTDFIYTFETGTKLEFFSADQPGKVRGPRRDILFINEANNVSYDIYTQLEIRTRDIIFLDWNPISEFWWYDDVRNRPDAEELILTYKDNEALSENEKNALESRKNNKSWWKVYGEGQLGEIESRIYRGWQIVEEVPHEARLERYGLDFGYTNDPTAIVAIYYQNGGYILEEVCYQKGLSNKQIYDVMSGLPQVLVIADSAEPKSIDELKVYGLLVQPAFKGPDSVVHGIQYVQSQRISVTKNSVNLIKEYQNYVWQVDKNGRIVNVPDHLYSHTMDAIRYGFSNLNSEQESRISVQMARQFEIKRMRIEMDSNK